MKTRVYLKYPLNDCRYGESISNKTKTVQRTCYKDTTIILDNGSTYKMIDDLNEQKCLRA